MTTTEKIIRIGEIQDILYQSEDRDETLISELRELLDDIGIGGNI